MRELSARGESNYISWTEGAKNRDRPKARGKMGGSADIGLMKHERGEKGKTGAYSGGKGEGTVTVKKKYGRQKGGGRTR